MPGSTPRLALPYPLGTDPIASGDDMINQLATKLEALNLAWQMAAGSVSISATAIAAGQGATPGPFPFPVGRFTVPPLVFIVMQVATAGSASAKISAHAVTKDQFYVGLQNSHPSSAMTFAATPTAWLAVQMTSAAAPG